MVSLSSQDVYVSYRPEPLAEGLYQRRRERRSSETSPRSGGRGIAVRLRKPGGMRIFQHFSGGLFLENLFDAARKRC